MVFGFDDAFWAWLASQAAAAAPTIANIATIAGGANSVMGLYNNSVGRPNYPSQQQTTPKTNSLIELLSRPLMKSKNNYNDFSNMNNMYDRNYTGAGGGYYG